MAPDTEVNLASSHLTLGPGNHLILGSGDHHVLALHGWFGSARGWGSLPELGWDSFSLVGHSMSGQAIQHALLQAPGRVRRLVGLNPVPATGVPFDDDGWALFSGAAASRGNRAAIINFTTGGRLTSTFIDRVVQHSLDNSTVEAFGAYLESWAKTDFSAQVQGNQAAVKVIVGEHDPALSAQVMEQTWMAFYPNAELEVLANAGHYPMLETPAALAASIEEFLGRP